MIKSRIPPLWLFLRAIPFFGAGALCWLVGQWWQPAAHFAPAFAVYGVVPIFGFAINEECKRIACWLKGTTYKRVEAHED